MPRPRDAGADLGNGGEAVSPPGSPRPRSWGSSPGGNRLTSGDARGSGQVVMMSAGPLVTHTPGRTA